MQVDDATATYRGYRRQALYALYRLFEEALPCDSIIQPEGHEDVAIYNANGVLEEIVQVKDYSSNLVASSFKPFFYERISGYCQPGSRVGVTIASFGPIGPELRHALAGDLNAQSRVVKTLSNHRTSNASGKAVIRPRLSQSIAKQIVEHIRLQEVDECTITMAIKARLQHSIVGIDPDHAFDFLMWWLLTSSEDKRSISRSVAIDKLTHVGRFLAGRAAFHAEWFQTIIPLSADILPTSALARLKEEFYLGGRVRFEHIVAGIDAPRSRFLTGIYHAFSRSNVVVVHSASGQGKTTLAYRYLKEFAAEDFRFEIKAAESLSHARQCALAITSHTSKLEVPTVIFVDVRPGDLNWVELVREVSVSPSIRVLVTIREEDWARSSVSAADFHYQDVSLDFDADEAKRIYEDLVTSGPFPQYLDFDEAWNRFGPKKTLLEFAYFISQSESLVSRIETQVRIFRTSVTEGVRDPSEERLLALVAVASAFEARLKVQPLVTHCHVRSPARTLELFEREYLIRQDDNSALVGGFHAIRSELLAGYLTDPALLPWDKVAAECIPLMDERDIEAFLFCAFSRRPDAREALLAALDRFEPTSWIGVRGVARALIWLGLNQYINENSQLVDEVVQETAAWQLILDWDLGKVTGRKGIVDFEAMGDLGRIPAEKCRIVRARQTDKERVFLLVRNWLSSRDGPNLQSSVSEECLAFAEVQFWIGHLGIQTLLTESVNAETLSAGVATLPVHQVGHFIRGVRESCAAQYRTWLGLHKAELVERIRKEAAIVRLDEDEESIVGHFVIDLDQQASSLRRSDREDTAAAATTHELTVERVDLLSQVFVGKRRYGAIAYGHRRSMLPSSYDDGEKSGVLASYLPPEWTPRLNAIAKGIVEYRLRPAVWEDYFNKLTELRALILSCLGDLRSVLASNPGQSSNKVLGDPDRWHKCRASLEHGLLLPAIAVDEWGFTAISDADASVSTPNLRLSKTARFDSLRKSVSEYFRALANFMEQCPKALMLRTALKGAEGERKRARILQIAATIGIDEGTIRLSVLNGCDAFIALRTMRSFVDEYQRGIFTANNSVAREVETFCVTMSEWAKFCYPPRKLGSKSSQRGSKPFEWSLHPTRNRIRSELGRLNKLGIDAQIRREQLMWDGKSGLWITFNVNHPIAAMDAFQHIWNRLKEAFLPDRDKIVALKAIDVNWEEIIVMPLVNGRCMEQKAYRHFKATLHDDTTQLSDRWRCLVPDIIPDEIMAQLSLDIHPRTERMHAMDRCVLALAILFHHIDHIADFIRLPSELDQVGTDILQSYFDREMERSNPHLQALFDSLEAILKLCHPLEAPDARPNLFACVQQLLELRDAIVPTKEFSESATLRLPQIVEWRDRLRAGVQTLSVASLYWYADCIHCVAYEPLLDN